MIAESAEILKLGLLFGEDVDATTMELPQVLSFQHKLIQEYLAAVYIAECAKLEGSFLDEIFPTWKSIKWPHREVFLFACGLLAETDHAHLLPNHAAKKLSEYTNNQIADGKDVSVVSLSPSPLKLLVSFQEEGKVSSFNPYIVRYPTCERPLAELLTDTQTVIVAGLDETDPLDLKPSSACILLAPELQRGDKGTFARLMRALTSTHTNVTALHLFDKGMYMTTLGVEFYNVFLGELPPPQTYAGILKSLKDPTFTTSNDILIQSTDGNLAKSIESWGSNGHLRHCTLWNVKLSEAMLEAFCQCTHLLNLNLSCCSVEKLTKLMAAPPPYLRHLTLQFCSLKGVDVNQIKRAVAEGRLRHLQTLNLQGNSIGETAVNSLLSVIATRPHVQMKLTLCRIGENGEHADVSDAFINEWEAKLKDTKIDVEWYDLTLVPGPWDIDT